MENIDSDLIGHKVPNNVVTNKLYKQFTYKYMLLGKKGLEVLPHLLPLLSFSHALGLVWKVGRNADIFYFIGVLI